MPLVFNPFLGSLDYTGTTSGGGAITGTGSAGQVAFWTGASNLSGDNAFEWDSVNKRVGIGIATGILAQLHTLLDVAAGGNSQHALFDQYNASNVTGPLVIGRRSRGTPSVPAAVIAGDQLLNLNARGDDSSGFVAGNRVNILFLAGGAPTVAWTGVSNPTRIDFNTTDVGSTSVSSVTPRLRIDDDGSILVNTPTKIAGSRVVVTGGALHVLAGNALRLQGAGAGFTSFVDPSHAPNIAYTLPAAQATVAGQVLTNDATGVLSWTTAGAGTASGDLSGTYPGPITVTRVNGGLLGTTVPVTQGDLLVADAAPSFARFAGNTTATRNYLSMTSSVPLWTTIPGTDVTGAALTTGAADPNVTIALGGTPATALLRAASITLGWSGQLAVGRGGTGLASGTSGGILGFTGTTTLASSTLLTQHALVLGGGAAATPSTPVGLGTTTTVLHGNAAGDPSFGAVSLTADVTGTLPIANGGTGAGTALAAFNALSPLDHTVTGDLLTTDGVNNSRLPIGLAARYLRSSGTAPNWVDVTLFDDFTQYTRLTGRAGTTNDTTLTSSADGTGTLSGAASGSGVGLGTLRLRGAASGVGLLSGTIQMDGIGSLRPNLTSITGVIGTSPTVAMDFSPTLSFSATGRELAVMRFHPNLSFNRTNADLSFIKDDGTYTIVPGGSAASGVSLFLLSSLFTSSTANLPPVGCNAFVDTHVLSSNNVDNSTTSAPPHISYQSGLTLQVIGGAGKLRAQEVTGYMASVHFQTGTAGQAITLDLFRGLEIVGPSNDLGIGPNPTVTDTVGIDIFDLAGDTNVTFTNAPVSIKSAGPTSSMRHAGPARFGSSTAAPTGGSILHVDGGYTVKRTAPLAAAFPYTLLLTDYYLGVTSTAAARTVNLPSAATAGAGKVYVVKDESGAAGTNNITIARAGADTIDGGTTVVIATNFAVFRLYSDGVSKWFTF